MSVLRALWAEQLKMKRTLALLLAPLIPLVIVSLQLAIVWQRQDAFVGQKGWDAWDYHMNQTLLMWLLLMFPLFITLETALLANLEHGNQQWKYLFSLPVPRAAIYLAKEVSGLAIVGLSLVAIFVEIIVSGIAMRYVMPGAGFEAAIPWQPFLRQVALAYVVSWLLISIHTWVATRWSNFVFPIAVGVVAMIIAVVAIQSDYGGWYPWTMPVMVLGVIKDGQMPMSQLLAGSVGGLVVALLGCWDVTRRDVL